MNTQSGEVSFSLKFKIDKGSTRDIVLSDSEKNHYAARFDHEFVKFGDSKTKYSSYKWHAWYSTLRYGPNVLKFEIDDDLIALFINDKLVHSINRKPGLKITQAVIYGVSKDDILLDFSSIPKN